MPSDFEPCGLSQLISLRYGSVPVVRAVGGLADTILDADASPDGYGFTFDDYSAEALTAAVSRTIGAFRETERWDGIRTRGMKKNFGWEQSASAYKDLYLSLLSKE
jgi:starch synthase